MSYVDYSNHWQIVKCITDKYDTLDTQSIHRADWMAVTELLNILRKLQAVYRAKEKRQRLRRKLAQASTCSSHVNIKPALEH